MCAAVSPCRAVSFSENLYNTNSEYDWGAFRQLLEELTLSWSPPSLFSLLLTQPGVYALSLSSHHYKHMVNFHTHLDYVYIQYILALGQKAPCTL